VRLCNLQRSFRSRISITPNIQGFGEEYLNGIKLPDQAWRVVLCVERVQILDLVELILLLVWWCFLQGLEQELLRGLMEVSEPVWWVVREKTQVFSDLILGVVWASPCHLLTQADRTSGKKEVILLMGLGWGSPCRVVIDLAEG
jgi:hypothetical protein